MQINKEWYTEKGFTPQIIELSEDFYSKNIGNIEINHNGFIIRSFFIINPTCTNISKFTRNEFMLTVKRESPNDKLMGLVSFSNRAF